jgi:hypothetical protein
MVGQFGGTNGARGRKERNNFTRLGRWHQGSPPLPARLPHRH